MALNASNMPFTSTLSPVLTAPTAVSSSRRADARHLEGQVAPHGRRAGDEAHVEALPAALVQQGVVHHGGLRRADVALQDVVPAAAPREIYKNTSIYLTIHLSIYLSIYLSI